MSAESHHIDELDAELPHETEPNRLLPDTPDQDERDQMQRSNSRNTPFSSLTPGNGSLFLNSKGNLDKHKVFLVIICSALFLWVFYDLCCHWHGIDYDNQIAQVKSQQRVGVGADATTVDGVLRAPGSADGKLPSSGMFKYTDSRESSFVSPAGVMAFPYQPDHVVKKQTNGMHVATILPGQTRGNHLHTKHGEVLVLVHGNFLLRVAKVGNDGAWIAEDHIFEIGLPANPFSQAASTVSATPIGIELPANVCHALRNLDPNSVAFFASYYVLGQDEKRQEPDRDTCRNNAKAFLA